MTKHFSHIDVLWKPKKRKLFEYICKASKLAIFQLNESELKGFVFLYLIQLFPWAKFKFAPGKAKPKFGKS